ncbi:hypothetical protein [Burkholderia pyrrocinia]|uniref:hypothetical protein n=1 Tax=Burkholderia pyrrocinia TaxID=60550 RepID=UPI00244617DE|nr:hypothetical protein [Burkholderia pyrrocinia]
MSMPTSYSDIALPTNGTMYRHCTKISRPWFLTDSAPTATSFGDVPGAGTGLTMTRRASAFCWSA